LEHRYGLGQGIDPKEGWWLNTYWYLFPTLELATGCLGIKEFFLVLQVSWRMQRSMELI